jgi:hypothetical protein
MNTSDTTHLFEACRWFSTYVFSYSDVYYNIVLVLFLFSSSMFVYRFFCYRQLTDNSEQSKTSLLFCLCVEPFFCVTYRPVKFASPTTFVLSHKRPRVNSFRCGGYLGGGGVAGNVLNKYWRTTPERLSSSFAVQWRASKPSRKENSMLRNVTLAR